jgi:hypothetical protein
VNGTSVAPLGAVINCEAEDLAWRDLAYSIEAQLDNWAWIVMLLLLFVLVRVLCICWLLQHGGGDGHRGYATVGGSENSTAELERIEAELARRAGVDGGTTSGDEDEDEDEDDGGSGGGGGGGGGASRAISKKRGGFAPYAALARESTYGESDSDVDEGGGATPISLGMSSDQIMQHHRRSSMSGSESETEGEGGRNAAARLAAGAAAAASARP